jgi:RNA polymerase sigma factor (sigma-70 family)
MTTEPLTRLVRNLRWTLDATDVASLADADLLARFRESRDPGAFETIVLRHGPRVLSACRQVLDNEADVEDAFQATFVVLMRDAKAVRSGRSLPHWLFGVAHRVALQARSTRKRRERLESGAGVKRESASDLSWREACAILHEELDRLPEIHRQPLMSCYLEGLTRDEAAAQLGRTAGSVKKSLERGRELLRKRLTRRGVTLSAGLLAAVADSAKAGMSPGLVRATIQCAAKPSAGAVTLARSVFASRTTGLRALGACLAASIAIVGVALGVPGQEKPDPADKVGALKAETTPAKKADDSKLPDTLTHSGTVVGPDGNSVKGAKLTLLLPGYAPLQAVGESGPDGKFTFAIKRKDLTPECFYGNGRELWSAGTVLVQAPGLAVGWGHGSVSPGYDMKLQIPVDDVPIEGRVKNLEGLPVAGATIRVVGLFDPKRGDLDDFYQDVKAGKLNQQLLYDHLITFQGDELKGGRLDPLYPPVKSGKDGSFTFKGIGRERMALMRIEGEGIETEDILVMARAADAVLATPPKEADMGGFRALPIVDGRHNVYGCTFEHAVAPSRPIVGVVRDLNSGKPVAGAVVSIENVNRARVSRPVDIKVVADKEGRYRLAGAPVKGGVSLRVEGPADQPYLATSVEVPQAAGVGPVEVDAKLKRGIWATVRVLDKADKSAVTAEVHYFALAENPNLKDLSVMRAGRRQRVRIENAEYRVPVLPGPGILAVRIPWDHNFVLRGGRRSEATPAVPYPFSKMDFLGHIKIDPPADSKGVTCEIGLNSSDD